MKKFLFSFILSVASFVSANADSYTGVFVTTGDETLRYVFAKKPTVKLKTEQGVTSANFYIDGEQNPVVSITMQGDNKLKVSYDKWIIAKLNTAGFATFSADEDSYIATDGVKAYKAKISDSDIVLTELEGYIPAGEGVLLYGGSDMAGTSVDLPVATEGSSANMEANALRATTLADGSLASKPAGDNVWSLGAANQFQKYSAAAFIHNRAYLVFTAPTAAKAMRLIFADDDDETTGIDSALSQPSSRYGKYLENGNIVIVKNGKKYSVGGQVVK